MTKLTICFVAIVFAFSCGKDDKKKGGDQKTPASSKKSPTKAAPAKVMEMAPIDVVHEDFKATMDAPKGAVFKESYGTLEIKLGAGTDFFVQIDTDTPDMAKLKKGVEANDVQKLVKFHTDTADTLVYETKAFGKTSFWLDSAVKVGAKTVRCYSGRGAPSFTRAHIASFEKACKSLKAK